MILHDRVVPPRLTFAHGFTLTEIAIVLFIVALLIGGLMLPLSAQDDIRRTQESQRLLAEIREATIGFAASTGRLPCPDVDFDGIEDPVSAIANNIPGAGQSTQTISNCQSPEGQVPFATLNTSRSDSWNRRFRYRVSTDFSKATVVWSELNASGTRVSATPAITLNKDGDITIRTRGDDPSTGAIEAKTLGSIATKVPAVFISHGKNGLGTRTDDGLPMAMPQAESVDETTNADINLATKISRTPTSAGAGCDDAAEGAPFCEFDDIVVWLSPNILYNRMIAAGRLP